jgi:hypothetical protein
LDNITLPQSTVMTVSTIITKLWRIVLLLV